MIWLDVDARGEMSPSGQRPKELCLVVYGSEGTEVARWGRSEVEELEKRSTWRRG
jgi:hypothetical protein